MEPVVWPDPLEGNALATTPRKIPSGLPYLEPNPRFTTVCERSPAPSLPSFFEGES